LFIAFPQGLGLNPQKNQGLLEFPNLYHLVVDIVKLNLPYLLDKIGDILHREEFPSQKL